MIQGLGCDILRIKRMEKWCFSSALLFKVFARTEIALLPEFVGSACTKQHTDNVVHRVCEQLAGMFSAKEAYKKAVGALCSNMVYMRDIIVEKHANGAPRLRLEGSAAVALEVCSARYALVSISHEREYAMATVIIGS